ncbi:hypothetical protein T4D_14999 [Trichinella pseudospiralis]|uniref:Uncharacterized protein n=1 Tax=Trichinella pseudospiralis TaxID=6337 RepID=A0A0V1F4Z0_TRIPS|nr:hypothetical protein T4D_14999 [Trichinella pseudospiralis]
MSALMELMKRKIDDLAERLDQAAIHNQTHGAAIRRQEETDSNCRCHVVGTLSWNGIAALEGV